VCEARGTRRYDEQTKDMTELPDGEIGPCSRRSSCQKGTGGGTTRRVDGKNDVGPTAASLLNCNLPKEQRGLESSGGKS